MHISKRSQATTTHIYKKVFARREIKVMSPFQQRPHSTPIYQRPMALIFDIGFFFL